MKGANLNTVLLGILLLCVGGLGWIGQISITKVNALAESVAAQTEQIKAIGNASATSDLVLQRQIDDTKVDIKDHTRRITVLEIKEGIKP